MTTTQSVIVPNVPDCLRTRMQWVCWKYIERDGRMTKMPVNPRSGEAASSTDPRTWATFTVALAMMHKVGYAGIGYVFAHDDPYYGVDLDDCIDASGKVNDEAQAIIDTLGTYAEVSPSGKGVKLIGLGRIPAECNRNRTKDVSFGEIEVYDRARFFTITGKRMDNVPLKPQDSHGAFQAFCIDHLFKPEAKEAKQPARKVADGDAELLERIKRSAQGPKFERLWGGSTADYGGDDSAADMALAVMLAWWSQRDASRIDGLFRQSGLMREKWDQRRGEQTYGQRTVKRAIEMCPDCYNPPSEKQWTQVLKEAAKQAGKLEAMLRETIDGKHRPLKWPWPAIHKCTRALKPQTLTILCGSPGASKSFLLLQAMGWWVAQGVPVSCLMLEDSVGYHMRRAMAQHCRNSHLTDDEWIEDNPDIVLDLHDNNRAHFDAVEKAIHEPLKDSMASIPYINAWMEEQAQAKSRVIAVDPITLADSGEKQWTADRQLIARAKQIAELYNVSIIFVTHPKNDVSRPYLDGVAGGKTITRAAQTVLWLEYLDEDADVQVRDPMLNINTHTSVNRKLHILKSRNAMGQGRQIGMNFLKDSLTFDEAGVITG